MIEPGEAQAAGVEEKREWRFTGIVFFGILALVLLYAAFMVIRPFITAIALGAILVTLTYGIFKNLTARMGGKRGRAAVVMLLGITFVVVIPALLLGMLLVDQANTLVENLQSGDAQKIVKRLDVSSRLGFIKRFAPGFDPATLSPERIVMPVIRQIPGWVARNGGAVLGGLAGAIIGFFLVLLSAYFFYTEGDEILQQLSILSPLPHRYDQEFRVRFKDVVDATFRGQVLTALAQGLATGIGLAIARVPGAALWGAVAALLSLLPMVGAAAVWVPATIYLYIAASMGTRGYFGAVFLTIWGITVVSLVDNVVRPWAMSGKAQLPAIPLLFAVLGGLQAFGFVGLVIGPLVFSLLMTIIDIYKKSFGVNDAGITTVTS